MQEKIKSLLLTQMAKIFSVWLLNWVMELHSAQQPKILLYDDEVCEFLKEI